MNKRTILRAAALATLFLLAGILGSAENFV